MRGTSKQAKNKEWRDIRANKGITTLAPFTTISMEERGSSLMPMGISTQGGLTEAKGAAQARSSKLRVFMSIQVNGGRIYPTEKEH